MLLVCVCHLLENLHCWQNKENLRVNPKLFPKRNVQRRINEKKIPIWFVRILNTVKNSYITLQHSVVLYYMLLVFTAHNRSLSNVRSNNKPNFFWLSNEWVSFKFWLIYYLARELSPLILSKETEWVRLESEEWVILFSKHCFSSITTQFMVGLLIEVGATQAIAVSKAFFPE